MVFAILLSYLSLESFKLLFYHPLAAPLNAEPQDAREKSAIFIFRDPFTRVTRVWIQLLMLGVMLDLVSRRLLWVTFLRHTGLISI